MCEWQKEEPTESGLYFVVIDGLLGKQPSIAGFDASDRSMCYLGDDSNYAYNDVILAWYGPIEVPALPDWERSDD